MHNEIDLDKTDINSEQAADEAERQHYFMAKCREWVSEFERKNGRRPTTSVQTFGCQMNARDSEKLTGILEQIGYRISDDEKADLVLLNTCTVRENANSKVYGHLGLLSNYKKKNKDMLIGLCGCMMQEKSVTDRIRTSFGFVDIVFGTHNIFKLAEILWRRIECGKQIIDIWDGTDKIVENLPTVRKYPFKSGVNIMFGCNNFCSYCIVPYVRGRERSRRVDDIVQEVEKLAADGVVEIMLLGQNVNSYGKEYGVTFAELLSLLERVEGIERIRFMTSHPKDLSDGLIDVMKNSKKICRQLHLPLQSGSSAILKKMNRVYDKEDYLKLVEKIKTAIPDIGLSTDIIVGFPGETEEDFEETLDVVEKVRYDSAYTFIYSKRTGTPAAAMEDQVPDYIVKERFDRLLKKVNEIAGEEIKKHLGKTMEVLAECENDRMEGYLTGRLSNNTVVHFKGEKEFIGKIVNVHLDEAKGFYYMGRLQS